MTAPAGLSAVTRTNHLNFYTVQRYTLVDGSQNEPLKTDCTTASVQKGMRSTYRHAPLYYNSSSSLAVMS